jgi:hypothetical protein
MSFCNCCMPYFPAEYVPIGCYRGVLRVIFKNRENAAAKSVSALYTKGLE